jgi:peroxiredoxin
MAALSTRRDPMRDVMLGLLILLPSLCGADQGKTQTPRERYEALLKQYDAPTSEYVTGRLKDKTKAISEQFLMLGRQHPGVSAAADALGWVVAHSVLSPEAGEAMSLLARDHAKSAKLASIIREIDELYGDPFEPIEKLCRVAMKASPHREVRGWACLTLGHDLVRVTNKSAHDARQYTMFMNGVRVPFVAKPKLTDADLERLVNEAVVLFEQVVGTYADIDGLGKAAKRDLLAIGTVSIGKTAPEIEGEDLDGKRFRLSDYRGRVVVLDFWNHQSCGICRAMYPDLRSLVERKKGKPFALLGINSGDEPQSLRKLSDQGQVTWRFWCDGDSSEGPVINRWNVTYWPTTFVVDAKGVIRYKQLTSIAELDEAVETLLKEMKTVVKP